MSPGSLQRAALLLALTCACSSQPTDTGPDGAGGSGAVGSGAAGSDAAGSGADGGVPSERCAEGAFPGTPAEPVTVGVVTGQIVDERGEPTAAGLVQVCGKDLCINARVDDNGKLAEDVGQEMDAPALKIGDGREWAKLAFAIGEGDTELGTLSTARLPDFAEGLTFAPGTTISSGGVTLELWRGTHVEVDTLTYETEAEQTFRAVPLPAQALSQVDADFVLGFGLAPVETRICPSPGLSLENTADLAPGTRVVLYMQGFDVLEGFAPYGGWQEVSEGVVADDGATLDFENGPPILTTIAVKVKEP